MQKILVIGSCGAGKSVFANQLHEKTGLLLIHLDQCYWKPNWERTPREEFREKVKEFVAGEQWIIDGNYHNTLDIRLPKSDTIIFLDYGRLTCLWGIIKRRLRKKRTDKLDECEERLTWELIARVLWKFPRVSRKEILSSINAVREKKQVYVFESRKAANDFLGEINSVN